MNFDWCKTTSTSVCPECMWIQNSTAMPVGKMLGNQAHIQNLSLVQETKTMIVFVCDMNCGVPIMWYPFTFKQTDRKVSHHFVTKTWT